MTYDKMTNVERVARALREVEWGQVSSWDDTDESDREYWRKSATAAIAALQSAAPVEDDVREEVLQLLKAMPVSDAVGLCGWSTWEKARDGLLALIERLSSTGGQGNG